MLIKDFNNLMFNKTNHKERRYFCMHCFQHFSGPDILTRHKSNCMVINGEQAIRMPQKENNTLKFQNFPKQMPVPFVIYADFNLRPLLKKYQGASLIIPSHILNHTKNILATAKVTKLFTFMMINILSRHRFTELRSQSRSLWKRC